MNARGEAATSSDEQVGDAKSPASSEPDDQEGPGPELSLPIVDVYPSLSLDTSLVRGPTTGFSARALTPSSASSSRAATVTQSGRSSTQTSRSKATSRISGSNPPDNPTSHRSAVAPPSSVRSSAAFAGWSADTSSYKVGPFVLLLLDEFLRHYGLTETAVALQLELDALRVSLPDAELWLEMRGQCHSILANKKHSTSLASATTIEKLVEFCASPLTRRAVFTNDMASAHSPMRVCASPKRVPSSSNTPTLGAYSLLVAYKQMRSPIVRPSQRPSSIVHDHEQAEGVQSPPPPIASEQHGEESTAKEESEDVEEEEKRAKAGRTASVSIRLKKKKRRHRSQSVVSMISGGGSPQRSTVDHSHGHTNGAAALAGTYGEPGLVGAHQTELRRDLTTTRLVEKEIRSIRLEKITTDPTKSLQKRLGFRTLSAEEETERQKQRDPYESALVLEKFGFSKRQECALCQFPFLEYNLPHKVSFKCIMDVYDAWQHAPPDRDSASKYKPPLCYDAVRVCRMCAQIVFQHTKKPATIPRPLSRKQRKAKSMAALPPPQEEPSFCADPYSLPPLLGDDVYDHRDVPQPHFNGRRGRGLAGLVGDVQDGELRVGVGESPAKAIVYAQQMRSGSHHHMSSKEWSVINPDKSSTRHLMEAASAVAAAGRRGSGS